MTLVDIALQLRDRVAPLAFSAPVTHVYNPLDYAWPLYRAYVQRFGAGPKEVVFVGMNPGPWGMAQTGVPFGEVAYVRDWMGLSGEVGKPDREHPKRPVQGLACGQSEVSGRRLWGWAADRFGSAEHFFDRFFVLNYCPLLFLEQSGRNRTPDKLGAAERAPLFAACDAALRASVVALAPRLLIGVGAWTERRCRAAMKGLDVAVGRVLHPSPANPAANRGWGSQAEAELRGLGVRLP